jgi:cytochrome P450
MSAPPTPRGAPLLGSALDLQRDTLGTLESAQREHGDVVRFVAGPPRLRSTLYAIFHPDAVRHVLSTEADRYRKDNRFYVYGVCEELIAERRARPTGGEDLLSLLIAARDHGDALDDAEIRDQILIFMLAGHDTTAIALTFALHLLGHHPDAQARLHAEVDEVLGDRTPTARDVEDLAYTAMVLKEAMPLPACARHRAARAERRPHRRLRHPGRR